MNLITDCAQVHTKPYKAMYLYKPITNTNRHRLFGVYCNAERAIARLRAPNQ